MNTMNTMISMDMLIFTRNLSKGDIMMRRLFVKVYRPNPNMTSPSKVFDEMEKKGEKLMIFLTILRFLSIKKTIKNAVPLPYLVT